MHLHTYHQYVQVQASPLVCVGGGGGGGRQAYPGRLLTKVYTQPQALAAIINVPQHEASTFVCLAEKLT